MDNMEQLARDILRLSRNTLLVNLRFLDMALSRLKEESAPLPLPGGCMGTDGKTLYFHPLSLLKSFKAERNALNRDYLHGIFHCVFAHPFVNTLVHQTCWNLACDIAVENAVNELNLPALDTARSRKQGAVLQELKRNLKYLTAEKIYRYYLDKKLTDEEYWVIGEPFCGDDHNLWYAPAKQDAGMPASSSSEGKPTEEPSGRGDVPGGSKDAPEQNGEKSDKPKGTAAGTDPLFDEDTKQFWADVARRMKTDLETFSKQQGSGAGGMMQELQAVTREKYDYTSFLRQFAVMGETMRINEDEFDYIFYTYGLSRYGNMPLIEPLEYKDEKRLKEFVIAIDTSGSCSGQIVQRFLQKTYNIFQQEESWFRRFCLHIIQCDSSIQEDAVIRTREEFDAYLKNMIIRGLGGTDFRPVFSYVNQLMEQKELRHLKGLIYFTDGWGTFPEHMPPYKTAFVFLDDDYNNYRVPPWAVKLILQSDDI